MKITKIYVLKDPRTDEVRYVGKTVKALSDRLSAHINESAIKKTHRGQWIASLLKQGLRPIIEEIDTALDDWAERERFWIAHYREQARKLTNQCDGGEGVCGIVWSDERRQKHSEKTKAFFESASPEWKKEFTDTRKRIMTPERRARISQKVKEIWEAPDYKARASEAYKAAWTPEMRAEYSDRLKSLSKEERSRRAKKGMENPETKRRISQSCKAAWTPEMRAAAAERARERAAKKRLQLEKQTE